MGILNDKICIVLGAASGIGRATVQKFIDEGATVYAIDKKRIDITTTKKNFECDIRDYKIFKRIINDIVKVEKRIDVFFNIVGIHCIGNIEETEIEEFRELLDINLFGCINALKLVLPVMKNNRKGSIILPGSDQSHIAKTDSCAYGISKAAISGLTKSLALDYAKYNIRINSICPGPVDTPMYNNTVEYILKNYDEYNDRDELLKILAERQPLGRIAKPEEIANVVAFVASDKANFMTGAEIKVDGGSTIGTL